MNFSETIVDKIDDQEILLIKFTNNNNFSIQFYNFGGYFLSVNIPKKNNPLQTEDVLLGYQEFENYKNDSIYLNAIVGRVCGRIANSSFKLNNFEYGLFPNIKPHHIHGGKNGFNKHVWTIENIVKEKNYLKCVLFYRSSHKEEGYPGNLECRATYILNNKNELIINFIAECDQDTIVNITNHNYWNFHGHSLNYQNIKQHYIKINSNSYCELDNDFIPTGKLLKVQNNKFDFLKLKKINDRTLLNQGIDTCYSINNFNNKIREVATVFSDISKMGMILFTNQPGLHFYTGNMMKNEYEGKYSRKYGYQYGLCFEPELFPDAINHNNFMSPILRKGEKYDSKIVMKLKNDF